MVMLRVYTHNLANTNRIENPRDTSEPNWRQQFSETMPYACRRVGENKQ